MSINQKYQKKILLLAAILGAITIAIGAFGAHGLKKIVAVASVSSFETGVRYQMYHVIALLFLGTTSKVQLHYLKWATHLFLAGIVLFSGSIYILALKEYMPFSIRFLGPITPLGGLSFILGWISIGMGVLKKVPS